MTRRTNRKPVLGAATAAAAALAAVSVAAPHATATEAHGPAPAKSAAAHPAARTTTRAAASPRVSEDVGYGTWKRDVKAVVDKATPYIRQRTADAKGQKQAVVLDVDNTSLETGFDFSVPQHPVRPVLGLAEYAQSRGAKVFVITARPHVIESVTEANLEDVGYPLEKLYVRHFPDLFHSAAEYKTSRRAEIEADGYSIIANIGNSAGDLAGGHAERTFKLPDYDGQLS